MSLKNKKVVGDSMERNRLQDIEVYRHMFLKAVQFVRRISYSCVLLQSCVLIYRKKLLNIVLEIFHQDIWIILTLLFMMNI